MSDRYAFPQGNEWMDHEGNMRVIHEGGMTLRDYFAGQALAGICSNPMIVDCEHPAISSKMLAKLALGLADTMLAERKSHEADRAKEAGL